MRFKCLKKRTLLPLLHLIDFDICVTPICRQSTFIADLKFIILLGLQCALLLLYMSCAWNIAILVFSDH